MSISRPLLTAFALTVFSVPCVFADDKPAARVPLAGESFATVKKESDAARQAWTAERRSSLEQAKKNGKEKEFKFAKPYPTTAFSPRFLAVAEANPEGPDALDALNSTLETSGGILPGDALETRAKAVKILHDYYVTKPEIKRVIKRLTMYDDPGSKALVADVIARNPDRSIQMAAYKGQIAYREMLSRFADRAKDPKWLESVVKSEGEGYVKMRLAMADKARSELDGLNKTLHEKYGDLINDLSVGQPMPALVSEDLNGKTATLADYKGKVVVVDIWATWCGPCKAMIPHEREMVARLKDKPFALVSISFDEKKITLTDFLAKEPMPWNHWWNGHEGKLMDTLDIQHYPTIFVLDAKGVIRYKNLELLEDTDAELEKAVNALLDEMVSKKTASN